MKLIGKQKSADLARVPDLVDDDMVQKIVDRRSKDSTFAASKLFEKGERNISEDLNRIKEAYKNKNGLVSDDHKQDLHSYLDRLDRKSVV